MTMRHLRWLLLLMLFLILLPHAMRAQATGPVSIGQFGCYPSGNGSALVDVTACVNSAIVGLPDGVELDFPCSTNQVYYFAGQVVFKGDHIYRGGSRTRYNGCEFDSNYSGPDAAFSFVGAGYVTLDSLRFHSSNSTSPPYTDVTFGWNATSPGSDYELRDVFFDGYASKALVYAIGSEVWRDYGSKFTLNGGGATYVYYTSGADDLAACSSCVSNSNTAQWHYGDIFVDYSATTTRHYAVGIGGTNTADLLFDGGYISAENTGGTAYGGGFYITTSNGGPITIRDFREEQGVSFFKSAPSLNIRSITLTNNFLTTPILGQAYFFDGTASGTTFNFITLAGNQVTNPTGTNYTSGVGDNLSGNCILCSIAEPFSVHYTALNPPTN